MKFNISFRNMDPSPAITAFAQEKSNQFGRYFQGKIHVTWNFTSVREDWTAHCHVVGNNIDFFGESVTTDIHASIEQTADKMEKQLRKHKEIVTNHHHHHVPEVPPAAEE